uniref:PKD_channel domain-containing protein n=1 Tax=Steinernema glaseri TaxID=37863 RepID=A0A1I8A9N1_9BILA
MSYLVEPDMATVLLITVIGYRLVDNVLRLVGAFGHAPLLMQLFDVSFIAFGIVVLTVLFVLRLLTSISDDQDDENVFEDEVLRRLDNHIGETSIV